MLLVSRTEGVHPAFRKAVALDRGLVIPGGKKSRARRQIGAMTGHTC